jgi:hypothetical protein
VSLGNAFNTLAGVQPGYGCVLCVCVFVCVCVRVRPSMSLGDAVNILADAQSASALHALLRSCIKLTRHVHTHTHTHTHRPLPSFDFNTGSDDPPINDDPRIEDNNVKERVNEFVLGVEGLAVNMRTVGQTHTSTHSE